MQLHLSPKQQLAIFTGLAFVIGWAVFLPLVLSQTTTSLFAFIGLFAPAVAAVVTAWLANGRAGVRAIFQRLLWWRFAIGWYALAILLIPAIYIVALLGQAWIRHTAPVSLWLGAPWYFVAISYVFLLVVTAGEELGWRGFVLPLLQAYSPHPVRNSVILGVVWGLWHAPLYLAPGPGTCPFPLFVLFTIALSVFYSLLFNQTGGSLIPALLLHASTDLGPRFLDFAHFTPLTWALIVTGCGLAALLCARRPELMSGATALISRPPAAQRSSI